MNGNRLFITNLDAVIALIIFDLPVPHQRMIGSLLIIGTSIRNHAPVDSRDTRFYLFCYHLALPLFGHPLKDSEIDNFLRVMNDLANDLTAYPNSDLAKKIIFK